MISMREKKKEKERKATLIREELPGDIVLQYLVTENVTFTLHQPGLVFVSTWSDIF